MADPKAMAERAQQSADTGKVGKAPDGSEFMNFSGKTGLCKIGDRQVQDDEQWLLNITSLQDGYMCWKGGQPLEKLFYNIFSEAPIPAPDPEKNGPFNVDKPRGEGWSAARAWVCKSLDYDTQGYFSLSSKSGVSEMSALIGEVAGRLGSGLPAWPVFTFEVVKFTAQGNVNSKPNFVIAGWLDDVACMELGADTDGELDLETLYADSAARGGGAVAAADPKAGGRKRRPADDTPPADTPPRRRRSAS